VIKTQKNILIPCYCCDDLRKLSSFDVVDWNKKWRTTWPSMGINSVTDNDRYIDSTTEEFSFSQPVEDILP